MKTTIRYGRSLVGFYPCPPCFSSHDVARQPPCREDRQATHCARRRAGLPQLGSEPAVHHRCVRRAPLFLPAPVLDLAVCSAALAANAHFLLFARIEYVVEFCTELVGTALFALFGGVADPAGSGRDGWPALGNGFTLAVLIYMTAKARPMPATCRAIIYSPHTQISGGKLNPAVSFALFMSGGLSLRVLISETVAQVAGAILGAALSRWFTHGTTLLHDAGVREFGCFGEQAVGSGISNAQVFAWECVCTFVLVSVVFATAVDDAAATHFVAIAPLAIGLSLFACAQASAPFTGGCLNPARCQSLLVVEVII